MTLSMPSNSVPNLNESNQEESSMNQLHIVMNGKGGIGKSIVAYNIAQYLKSLDPDALCIDTDPLTPTLSKYPGLKAVHIQIASEAEVYLNRFDEMIEKIIASSKDVVI